MKIVESIIGFFTGGAQRNSRVQLMVAEKQADELRRRLQEARTKLLEDVLEEARDDR